MKVKINWQFPDWQSKYKMAETDILLGIAASLQTNRGMMFMQEGADNGKPRWAPLKFRTGMILQDRGTLRMSWAPKMNAEKAQKAQGSIVEFTNEAIIIGSSLAYASMMNWGTTNLPGGVLRAVNAKALKIPLPQGKSSKTGKAGKFMFRKSVKIPARRMDLWTEEDAKELEAATVEILKKYVFT